MTSSTPAWLPIAFAVLSLSPVSITTLIPMPLSSSMACAESSLMVSATAIIPASLPPKVNSSGVLPSAASCSAPALRSAGTDAVAEIYLRLPPASSFPSRTALRPFPGSASKPSTSGISIPSALADTALASGCSLFASRAAASLRSSSLGMSTGMMSVTLGCPSVMVPVLSRATTCTLPAPSRDAAVL